MIAFLKKTRIFQGRDMDRIDKKILSAVQGAGRISMTELSKYAGLSIPATTERLRKLEDSGVISGYGAQVDPIKLGFGVSAVVGITTFKPSKSKLIATLSKYLRLLSVYTLRVTILILFEFMPSQWPTSRALSEK